MEEFFLPCTEMSRKFHSCHLVWVISGTDLSDDQRVVAIILSQGLFLIWNFSVCLCHQIGLWMCTLCICIKAASFASLHLSECFTLFSSLPSILVEIFGTAALIWMCIDEIHKKAFFFFYSSNRTQIQKHAPAWDYCCFISHIPIEPSNNCLEQQSVLTPSFLLF